MIATAGLRPWLRGAALVAVLLGVAGVVLGLGAGPAGAGQGASGVGSAKKDLLVTSDFPSGWSAQGGVTTGSGGGGVPAGFISGLVSCLGVSANLLDLGNSAPSVNSPTFTNKNQTETAQDSVTVFPTAKVAAELYQVLSSAKVPDCLTNVMQEPSVKAAFAKSAGSGATIGAVTVSAANPNDLVPHSSGFAMVLPITVDGIALNGDLTVVTMDRGRVQSEITYTGVGLPFPAALERHLDTVAYHRT